MPSLLAQQLFEPSLENMQQQKPDFFNELTVIFERNKRKDLSDREAEMKVSECIKKYTGLTMATTFARMDPMINAWIESTPFDQAHIFWDEYLQQFDEFTGVMKKPLNGAKGYIDTVNGRVDGIFSDYINKLTITGGTFRAMTPEQLAAVTLHEVGHAYTFVYYLGHVAISNLVVTQAVRKALKVTDLAERTKIIKQAADYLDISPYEYIQEGDIGLGPEFSNELRAETLMLNAYRNRHKSSTGTDIYDIRSCEQLADQFAVRHGAGYALAQTLDKLEGRDGAGPRSRASVWFERLFAAFGIFFAGVATFGILPLLFLWGILGLPQSKEYDDVHYRLRLIKQNMIDRLRTATMDPEERKSMIRQIEKAEQLEKNNKEPAGSVTRLIMQALSKSRAREMETEKLQKYLEDMVFSRLFVTHAKLDILGV